MSYGTQMQHRPTGIGLALALMLIGSTLMTARPVQQDFGQIRPPRDAAPPTEDAPASSVISGGIVAANTGQPLKRARVIATGRETRVRVVVRTDEAGRYVLGDLGEGRYTLTVSKPGFITLSYGQRRPRQPATPVQVGAGQHLQDVNFTLPAGSVVTGRVADEDGTPLPLATVRLLRYVYQQGQRQLVPVGVDRTDDRGLYRVFGLEPGDYLVSAIVSRQLLAPGGGRFGADAVAVRAGQPGRFPNTATQNGVSEDDDPFGYAPTYYPGVTSVAEAVRVTVGLSAEVGAVDFAIRLVPTATVSGVVFGPDGTVSTAARVVLMPDDGAAIPGATLGSRVEAVGGFAVRNVPPGRYMVRAITRSGRRGGRGFGGTPTFASQPLTVDGYDVTDVTLVLAPGATVTGSIVFDTANQTDPPTATRVRVQANSLDPVPFLAGANVRVNGDGTFRLENVAGGRRLIRASGVPEGWTLKAVFLDGQDVIDTPLDFGGASRVDGLRLVFTDQVSELSGVVHDNQGSALTDFTVIAFPSDASRWQPGSRYIQAARPDQNARYQIHGLPPGEYLLSAVEVVEQGEWYDPRFLQSLRSGALRLSLDDGETRELNLALSSQTP